jgi:tetratricopeptide (TPR) repeat protein
VILTTRTQHLGKFAQRLEIDALKQEPGAVLLLRRAGLIGNHTFLKGEITEDQALALTLTTEMGGLPLALDQAGAYIEATQCSLADYQQQYSTQKAELLAQRNGPTAFSGGWKDDHPESVATTWDIAFRRVSERSPLAAVLLTFCAYLAPDAIPDNILLVVVQTMLSLEKVAAEPEHSKFALDEAISVVRAFSLFQRDSNSKTVSIHRLVQSILRDSQSPEKTREIKQLAVLVVNTACPNRSDVAQWSACERWVPHAQVCARWIVEEQIENDEVTLLLNQAGYYLLARGRYREAEPLLQQALRIRERHLGAEHLGTATSLNNLADLYRAQGKYREAEPLYGRALSIHEQQLGIEHPNTALSLDNLAALYKEQGKCVEAEPLLQRALSIHERQLGVEHPDTAMSLNNLAVVLYSVQGKDGDAEPLYERALLIRERQLGANHPDTAMSLDNLAVLYRNQRKYIEAEPLFQQALLIREQQLGANHPDTATSLDNLAMLYYCQEKHTEAEPLYEQALSIRERQLGADHPDTAMSLDNLAVLYSVQGKYREAESLHQRALSIRERRLGADHPDTAQSLNNLALLYKEQGKYADAEPLLQRALLIQERQLGATHPNTATSLNNLAVLYGVQGKYREAELLLQRAISIAHPQIADSLCNLADLYRVQGKNGEAELLYQQALVINEQILGPEHPQTQLIRTNLKAVQQSFLGKVIRVGRIGCYSFIIFIFFTTWFFHKNDPIGWIALTLTILLSLFFALMMYGYFVIRAKRSPRGNG